jgi:hypothetical protein
MHYGGKGHAVNVPKGEQILGRTRVLSRGVGVAHANAVVGRGKFERRSDTRTSWGLFACHVVLISEQFLGNGKRAPSGSAILVKWQSAHHRGESARSRIIPSEVAIDRDERPGFQAARNIPSEFYNAFAALSSFCRQRLACPLVCSFAVRLAAWRLVGAWWIGRISSPQHPSDRGMLDVCV